LSKLSNLKDLQSTLPAKLRSELIVFLKGLLAQSFLKAAVISSVFRFLTVLLFYCFKIEKCINKQSCCTKAMSIVARFRDLWGALWHRHFSSKVNLELSSAKYS